MPDQAPATSPAVPSEGGWRSAAAVSLKHMVLGSIALLTVLLLGWLQHLPLHSSPQPVHWRQLGADQEARVAAFRAQYAASMQPLDSPNVLTVLGSDAGAFPGFGSIVNQMMSGFHYATTQGIGRQFHLSTTTWVYGPWLTYFEDTMRSDAHNLSLHIDRSWLQRLNVTHGVLNYTVISPYISTFPPPPPFEQFGELFSWALQTAASLGNHSVPLVLEEDEPRPQHYSHPHYNPPIIASFNALLVATTPVDRIIEDRRVLLQSIWAPRQYMRDRCEKVLGRLHDSYGVVTQHFLAVHVRRGDKIHEAGLLSADVYTSAIMDLITAHQLHAVVLASDDAIFLKGLKSDVERATWGHVPVYIVSDLQGDGVFFGQGGWGTSNHMTAYTKSGWDQANITRMTAGQQRAHTEELILALMVMARAAHVICTHSSNICRVVQLLRWQPHDTVHSLDAQWHPY